MGTPQIIPHPPPHTVHCAHGISNSTQAWQGENFVLFAANNHNVMHYEMSYVDIVDYVVSALLGLLCLIQHNQDRGKNFVHVLLLSVHHMQCHA